MSTEFKYGKKSFPQKKQKKIKSSITFYKSTFYLFI